MLVTRLDKMSKSKNNGVDPDEMVGIYGADTIRLFSLFASPPERDLEWSDLGIEGSFRFLNRMHRLAFFILEATSDMAAGEFNADLTKMEAAFLDAVQEQSDVKNLFIELNRTIKKVTEDIGERMHLNTAVAALMEFSNSLSSAFNKWQEEKTLTDSMVKKKLLKTSLLIMSKLLAPMTPHLSEEIFHTFQPRSLVAGSSWPIMHPSFAVHEEIEIVFQVNGKIRNREIVAKDISRDEMKKICLENEKMKLAIAGKSIVKVIVVPGKLVNIVVK
jgi:leucyl-tRNA synthetase